MCSKHLFLCAPKTLNHICDTERKPCLMAYLSNSVFLKYYKLIKTSQWEMGRLSVTGLCCLLNKLQSQISHLLSAMLFQVTCGLSVVVAGGDWAVRSAWRCCGNISSFSVWLPAAVINGKQQTHQEKYTACIDRGVQCKSARGGQRQTLLPCFANYQWKIWITVTLGIITIIVVSI